MRLLKLSFPHSGWQHEPLSPPPPNVVEKKLLLTTMHLTVAITTLLAAMAAGHAHHDHDAELAQRRDFFLHSRSNLNHCTSKMAEAGIEKRAAHRRAGLASDLAKRNGVRGMWSPDWYVSTETLLNTWQRGT